MTLWQDIKFGVRVLRAAPGFTITAVITLALGIGATTAIFSVCDAMLWKPMPLPGIERLAVVLQAVPGNPDDWNTNATADVLDIQKSNRSFSSIASFENGLANLAGAGSEPARVEQALVTANFFETLGVQPVRGRGFQPGEDQLGHEREAILSDNLWRNRFGADAAIVGKTIHVDDVEYTVVGVMPKTFDYPLATQIWTPLAMKPEDWNSRLNLSLQSVARLKPGVTMQQAAADLDGIARQLEQAWPATNKNRRFLTQPLLQFMIGKEDRQYATMLLGAVLFVLLIACLNVANLQFARSTARIREVALRTALGAGRGRIVAQLLTESVLLALAGAIGGLLLGRWGMHAIQAGMPVEIEKYVLGWSDIALDGRALLFTFTAAVGSGVLAGLIPALQTSRPNIVAALKEGGRGGSAGGHHRLRRALVAAEMALAVVLLVGGSLMVRGFESLLFAATHLEPQTLLTMRLAITETRYPKTYQVADFYQRVVSRVNALPGVRSAVAVNALPYSGHANSRYVTIEGKPQEAGNRPVALFEPASPGYLATLHIPLLDGRAVDERDGVDAPKTAVISRRFADLYFHGESPIGKHVKLGLPDTKNPWLTIVGVAGDVVHNVYDRGPRAVMYVSGEQFPSRFMDLGVRTAGDPLALAPAVIAAIHSVDPEEPVTDIRSMETAMHQQATGMNFMAVLMGLFGVLALVLSSIGVYGVMAYLVTEQTREIGIRLALGSGRGTVLAMVFRRGMLTAAVGLLIGVPAAYGFAKLLSGLVFGVSATDPATFVGIPLALAASAALAIWIPARRASRVDPIVALRYE